MKQAEKNDGQLKSKEFSTFLISHIALSLIFPSVLVLNQICFKNDSKSFTRFAAIYRSLNIGLLLQFLENFYHIQPYYSVIIIFNAFVSTKYLENVKIPSLVVENISTAFVLGFCSLFISQSVEFSLLKYFLSPMIFLFLEASFHKSKKSERFFITKNSLIIHFIANLILAFLIVFISKNSKTLTESKRNELYLYLFDTLSADFSRIGTIETKCSLPKNKCFLDDLELSNMPFFF